MNDPSTDDSPFDLSQAQREALGRAALDWVLEWLQYPTSRPLYPALSAADMLRTLGEGVPDEGQDPMSVLDEFSRHVVAGARAHGKPRMFGYVQSRPAYVGVLADFLASALNQNVTSWRSAPSPTTIERQTIDWIKTIVGFGPKGEGLFVSGGSVANLVGVAAALASVSPKVAYEGVRSLPGEPVVYASALVHMSILKAAGILGLGHRAVRRIAVDEAFRMDTEALERAIDEDRRAGRLPVCVVANGGDVNTGAVDPLADIAAICRRLRVWFHVDGAYGGFAVLSPSGRDALAGLGLADSMSLDPHKWLFAPLDVGCVLVRDQAALTHAFSYSADYVDVVATPDMSDYAFWNYGPELTRRFRALKVWMILKCHGTRAIGQAIERNIALARHLGRLVDEAPDFERLAPVPLSIVCFRYVTASLRTALASRDAKERRRAVSEVNALNRNLMVAVQTGGGSYLSNAMIGDAFALRACIVNFRTTEGDLERLLGEIRAAAAKQG
jgi:glutamate/tyrosine decarboxylase-like PLP-dependent enzyme